MARADSLLAAGDTTAAMLEYRRRLHFHGQDPAADSVRRRLGNLVEATETPREVAFWHHREWDAAPDGPLRHWHAERAALFYVLAGLDNDVVMLADLYATAAEPQAATRRRLEFYRLIALNHQNRWDEAQAVAKARYGADSLLWAEVQMLYATAMHTPLIDPNKAKWLSFAAPGSGQWYAGVPYKGVISGGLVAGVGGLLTYSIIQQHYFFAFFTVFTFAQMFYEGGAVYAVRLAEQRNADALHAAARRLNLRLMELERFLPDGVTATPAP